MKQQRAQQFRLYPTPDQADQMARIAGACRFVYNLALDQRLNWYRPGRRFSYVQQAKELTQLRAEVDWLRDCPVHALQAALKDVDRAFTNWWAGRAAAPTFRKKGDRDSYRQPDPKTFAVKRVGKKTGMVKLPKIGWVRFRGWFERPGDQKLLTVSRRAGRWYVSMMRETEVEEPQASNLPPVGIDRGIAVTLATSDGEMHHGPAAYKRAQKRLAHLQRGLARKQKGSARRAKQKAKIARLHARVSNIRLDWLHKQTTDLAKNHGVVVLEDLRVRQMSKSAKGTIEAPGRNVRQKAGLSRSILDQGWYAFSTLLDYKLRARGGELVVVPAAYTSQTCSECGTIDKASRLDQATYACGHCGHVENADTNAAKNILRQGLPSMRVKGAGCGPVEARTTRCAA